MLWYSTFSYAEEDYGSVCFQMMIVNCRVEELTLSFNEAATMHGKLRSRGSPRGSLVSSVTVTYASMPFSYELVLTIPF